MIKSKIQNLNDKINLKFLLLVFAFWIYFGFYALSFVISSSYTQDITILYTGETHASLYPCHCPSQPDGGLARRATKIKELRKGNPSLLLIDSGGFFAGGVLDENSQNTELDKLRTQITLKAYTLMGYDALAIGDEEFNFGNNFLKDAISQSKTPFLSSNIESKEFLPFMIKEIAGIKLGIFALTTDEAKTKSELNIVRPQEIASNIISQLKEKGAKIIILLSHSGEDVDLELLQEIKGIDILLSGHRIIKRNEPFTKIADTILLRPAWEGRKLGRCDLKIEQGKIVDFKVEQIRLSSEIEDDPEIKKILPECFSDKDCRKPEMIGKCTNPATIKARCEFTKPNPIDLSVIRPKVSKVLYNIETPVNMLKRSLAGIKVNYLDYPSKEADSLIKKLEIKMLPVYILPSEIEKEPGFLNIEKLLDKKDKFYLVKPSVSGVMLFAGRERRENRLDVFLTLKEKDVDKLLLVLKEFREKNKDKVDIELHLLPGAEELKEEHLRIVSVIEQYPLKWWDYLICRTKDIKSSWWDDCLKDNSMDLDLIKSQARSPKSEELLRENIRLTQELEINNGPTFLLENQEIFSTQSIPTIQDLERVVFGPQEGKPK